MIIPKTVPLEVHRKLNTRRGRGNISLNFSSVTQSCPTLVAPWTAACQTSVYHQLLELAQHMYIELVMPSNHLILCCPLLLLPSVFPSIRVFFIESVLHIRWPKYWSFSFSISPSSEYSGLMSFRIDWFELAVQGTLKSSPTPKHEFFSTQLSL